MKLKLDDAIKRFKQRNGGTIEYSTKEIVTAIWEKLDGHERRITYNDVKSYFLIVLVVGIYLKMFVV